MHSATVMPTSNSLGFGANEDFGVAKMPEPQRPDSGESELKTVEKYARVFAWTFLS
jgi:hypothetical protein